MKNRVNEDAWLVFDSPAQPGLVTIAIIDGAGVRKKLPSIISNLQNHYLNLTPAAYASYIVKTSLLDQFRKTPDYPLYDALVNANEALRWGIEQMTGSFEPAKILAEIDEPLRNDLRNVRLALPTCVLTLARLNLTARQLEFAHIGDTSLLEICRDGNVIRHTKDQMEAFDRIAFEGALGLQKQRKLAHFKDAVTIPEGRHFIVESGLRLNYVDESGKTDREQGCGVANGLPEMKDYIEVGTVSINPEQTLGFIFLTDGLELLSPLYETDTQHTNRLRRTGRLIGQGGLLGLYNAGCKMAQADMYFDRYPRTKLQDDATGIYIQLESEK